MTTVGMIGGKFLPLHMGHVYAITKAACMVDELYVVLSHSQTRDKKLCEGTKMVHVPATVRLRWLSQIARDMENVKVLAVEDFADSNETYDWADGAAQIITAIKKPINVVFSSEVEYGEIFKNLYPGAKHVVIDAVRKRYPISATKIRNEGVAKHWDFIPEFVRPYFVKKVVLVGTESCGKSTLTRYLAKLYNTSYVEEYGRTICENLGGCDGILTDTEYEEILYKHKVLEIDRIKTANKVLFIDTEAIVTQYFAELYLGHRLAVADAVADTQKYDLWLFLEADVKWVDDGTRDFGEEKVRKRNNKLLKEILAEKQIPYVTIAGDYHNRLEKAIDLVDHILV